MSQMKTQWTWSVVIATLTVQPLERAVPQSAGIVHQRAGARRVVLDVAAASRQRAVPQMMIATMTVQPLECRRAVPQSVGIVYPRAGARRVVVDAAAASRQPLWLVRRVDLAGSRVRWRLRMTPQTTVCWNRLRVLQPRWRLVARSRLRQKGWRDSFQSPARLLRVRWEAGGRQNSSLRVRSLQQSRSMEAQHSDHPSMITPTATA